MDFGGEEDEKEELSSSETSASASDISADPHDLPGNLPDDIAMQELAGVHAREEEFTSSVTRWNPSAMSLGVGKIPSTRSLPVKDGALDRWMPMVYASVAWPACHEVCTRPLQISPAGLRKETKDGMKKCCSLGFRVFPPLFLGIFTILRCGFSF